MGKRLKSRSCSTRILDTLEVEAEWVTLDEICVLLSRFGYPQGTIHRAVYRLVSYGLLEVGRPFRTQTWTSEYEFKSNLPNLNHQVFVAGPYVAERQLSTFRLSEAARRLESDWRRLV